MDHVTYGNMLRCSKLLAEGDQRDAMVSSTFQLCCQHGFVNSFVLRDLQDVASPSLCRELTQQDGGEVMVEQLPARWSRRFHQKKMKQRQQRLNREEEEERREQRQRQRQRGRRY